MKRAYVFNTGCIRRALDSTRLYDYLITNGWSFTNNISAADLVVVTTCSAVGQSEDLSVIALEHVAKKISKNARLIITGCLPKVNPEKLREIPGLGAFEFIPTGSLDNFDTALDSKVKLKEIPDANMVTNEIGLLDYVLAYRLFRHSFFLSLYKKMSTSRMFLKTIIGLSEGLNRVKRLLGMSARDKIVPYYNLRIAEGCAFKCAYCCIKFATGNVKSKPIDQIVAEFKKGLAQGHKVFQLVCEDVGCYGIDIGSSLPELLRNLLAVEGDYQLVMIDFGGHWLVKYYDQLRPLLLQNPDKFRELYVALQSGSNRILKAMRRPEKIEDVTTKLKELKREMPHLIIRTTVIIGFPGETETDFQGTVDAIRDIDFAAVELNRYEDRPGTVSSGMNNKVPEEVIDRRIEEISQHC
ncbi:MAG: radical SAM protein [Planctomycetota bacterium]